MYVHFSFFVLIIILSYPYFYFCFETFGTNDAAELARLRARQDELEALVKKLIGGGGGGDREIFV